MAEAPCTVPAEKLRVALDTVAFETIRPLTTALTPALLIVAVIDWLSREPSTATVLASASGTCVAALLWLRATLRHSPPKLRAAPWLIASSTILVLFMLLFRAYVIPGPAQLAGISVTMIASGFFLLSAAPLCLVLAIASCGWFLITWISPAHSFDAATAMFISSATLISLAAHSQRVRTVRREEGLRLAAERAVDASEISLQALVESEARTRSVIDNALDAVIGMDGSGIITQWNKQAESVFGWPRAEAVGQPLAELIIPAAQRDAHREGLRRYFEANTGKILDRRIEVEALHRNGNIFPAELAVSAIETGDRTSFSAFVRDITQRQQLEAALRAEARISSSLARVGYELISSLSAPGLLSRLCELTAETLECDLSHTFLFDTELDAYVPVQTHGHSSEEWNAIRLIHFPIEAQSEVVERLKRESIVQVDPTSNDFPFTWMLERYDIGPVLLIALRRGPDIVGVQTAAFRTRREPFNALQLRMARELAQIASMALDNARLFEEVERASRMKSEFVATMSHELRTPLNVILGYHELLLESTFKPLNPEQSEILQRCNRSALQLRELITATLDMSRLEAGRMDLELEDVDLAKLAIDIDNETQPFRADKPEVELYWDVPDDLPDLNTDRSKLKVSLKNLVSNAVKFTDSGSVTVSMAPSEDGITVSVADTGIGMTAEAIETIFEPFQQVDGSSTRRHGGVGLGLYIVQRLVEMLGGTIEVQSEIDKGTTFYLKMRHRWHSTAVPEEPPHAETEDGPMFDNGSLSDHAVNE
jgi:PAS domain S-box-containing protein